MTKLRLLTYVLGGIAGVAAALIPLAAVPLTAVSAGLIGLATRWPQDAPPNPPSS